MCDKPCPGHRNWRENWAALWDQPGIMISGRPDPASIMLNETPSRVLTDRRSIAAPNPIVDGCLAVSDADQGIIIANPADARACRICCEPEGPLLFTALVAN